MARFTYFHDAPDGATFELSGIHHDGSCSTRPSAFRGRCPSGQIVAATRRIEYSAHPSRHQCDARCQNASGRIMKCECSCGGRNHGKGAPS